MNRPLTAILDSPNRIIFTDVVTGANVNQIHLDGDIVNGPIVVGDNCTVTIQTSGDRRETRVYKMSTGVIIRTHYPL
jgi:hypothetical protein